MRGPLSLTSPSSQLLRHVFGPLQRLALWCEQKYNVPCSKEISVLLMQCCKSQTPSVTLLGGSTRSLHDHVSHYLTWGPTETKRGDSSKYTTRIGPYCDPGAHWCPRSLSTKDSTTKAEGSSITICSRRGAGSSTSARTPTTWTNRRTTTKCCPIGSQRNAIGRSLICTLTACTFYHPL